MHLKYLFFFFIPPPPSLQLSLLLLTSSGSVKVYGSTDREARELRELHGNSGHLRRGLLTETGGPLLPFATPNTPVDCKRDREESEIGCFLAGDVRANEQVTFNLIKQHQIII